MTFINIPVLYINLDSRPDRNENVKNELNKIGIINPVRFKAIKLDNGALGCSMSHLKCIEIAKLNKYDNVFICEDDIEFLNPELFLNQIQLFLDSKIVKLPNLYIIFGIIFDIIFDIIFAIIFIFYITDFHLLSCCNKK